MDKLKDMLNQEVQSGKPSEELVIELIGKIATEEYKESCCKDALAAKLAKQRVQFMKPQNEFNATYFNDIVKTVLLSNGRTKVRIITKTDSEVGEKEDDE